MIKCSLKIGALSLLGMALACGAAQTQPQPTNHNTPTIGTEKKESSDKKPSAGPFHAKLAAVDRLARTITVGKRTFLITSETKINKGGKTATLEDGVVGEQVSGYVKPTDDGKLAATKVNFGPKSETKAGEKKKQK